MGLGPKTVPNNHALIESAVEPTAGQVEGRVNPCSRIGLPRTEKIEDDAVFLHPG
ncbi:hypothetical protein [Arthrobacter sp. SDTb3-6]|uniref:hypothetical protein n=1 Tax=Arthrobacter sp. SDTb3-6 TaxID=2713571 RepID=UPI00159E68C8|nr:hypothetical protein [Arthrobacter sp. SDTb3-6]NVN00763.1 hypothetical protein [Arthrobacter sp. SDTb3-6]